MIGTNSDVLALYCDLCNAAPPCVFEHACHVNKYAEKHGWAKVVLINNTTKFVCPKCAEQIIVQTGKETTDGENV